MAKSGCFLRSIFSIDEMALAAPGVVSKGVAIVVAMLTGLGVMM
jgi:hypothetical protein